MSSSQFIGSDMESFHFLVNVPMVPLPVLVPIEQIDRTIKSVEYTSFPSSIPYLEGVLNLQGHLIKVVDLDLYFGGRGSEGKEGLVFNVGDERLVVRSASIMDSIIVSEVISILDLREISGQNLFEKSMLVKDGISNLTHYVLSLNLSELLQGINNTLAHEVENGEPEELRTIILDEEQKTSQKLETFQSTPMSPTRRVEQEQFELRFTVSGYIFSIPLNEVGFLIRDLKLSVETEVLHQFVLGYVQHQQQIIPVFDPKYLHDPEGETKMYSQAIVLLDRVENMYFGIAVDGIDEVHSTSENQYVSREIYPMIYPDSEYFIEYITWDVNTPIFHIDARSLFLQLMRGKMEVVQFDKPYEPSVVHRDVDPDQSHDFIGEKNHFIISSERFHFAFTRDNFISIIRMQELFGDEKQWIIYRGDIVPIFPVMKDLFGQEMDYNSILIYQVEEYLVGIPFTNTIDYGEIHWTSVTSFNVAQILGTYASDFMSVVGIIGFGRIGGRDTDDRVVVSIDDHALERYVRVRYNEFNAGKIAEEEITVAAKDDQFKAAHSMEEISNETVALLLFEVEDTTYAIEMLHVKGVRREQGETQPIEDFFDVNQQSDNPAFFELDVGDYSFSSFRDIRYFYKNSLVEDVAKPYVKAVIKGDEEIFVLDLKELIGEKSYE